MPKASDNIKAKNLTLGIRLFLFLLIVYCLYLSAAMLGVHFILSRGYQAFGAPDWHYVRVFYHIQLMFVIFASVSTLSFASFLFYNKYKKLPIFAILSSIFAGVAGNVLFTDWSNKVEYLFSETSSQVNTSINLNLPFFFYLPILIPLAALLYLNRKMVASKTDKYFSKKRVIFVIYFFLFTVIPVSFLSYTSYISWHPTYDYQKLQKIVDYHLYFPTQFPENKALTNNFSMDLYKDMTWVKTVIGTPIYLPLRKETPGIMIFRQTKMPAIFNLKRFAQDYYASDSAAPKKLNLKDEFVDSTFLKSKTRPDSFKKLLLLTKQNTLIEISGVNFTDEDYALVANGLE